MNDRAPCLYPQRLKLLRQKYRMSASGLACQAGISPAHIHRLERGARPNVSAVTLARVALALNTSIEYLLGLTNDSRSIREILSERSSVPPEGGAENDDLQSVPL